MFGRIKITLWVGTIIVTIIGCSALRAQICPAWYTDIGTPGIGGTNSSVTAIAEYDDGNGPAIYVGGRFSQAGGLSRANIAKWNGSGWDALGNGTSEVVFAITTYDDGGGNDLYVGGYFAYAGLTAVNNIARWDGSSWSFLGSGGSYGVNNAVKAFGVLDGKLYVGGSFTRATGLVCNRIAQWDGASWAPLGTAALNGLNGSVSAIATAESGETLGPAVYVGGSFSSAGSVSTSCIAKWTGSAWDNVGGSMNAGGTVLTLLVHDDILYVGGKFTNAGGVPANRVAMFDGVSWSPMGSGLNNDVQTLAVFDDGSGPAIYAGGSFTLTGGSRFARWTGSDWEPVGDGTNNAVTALLAGDDLGSELPGLYVGGSFTQVDTVPSNNIAMWKACPPPVPGDCTGDYILDLDDYAELANCLAGPNAGALSAGCECADLDEDSDVDLADFAVFAKILTD